MSEQRSAAVTIPANRYNDRQFVMVENSGLWRKSWLLAGTVDHLAQPGDFVETRFGLAPVMVVRGDDGRLRGFENVCQHQAAPLCRGSGGGLTEIRCPQHQWTWDLAGRLQAIDFGQPVGPDENIPLLPVHVETWGPLVFASFDLGAEPLVDAIAPLIAAVEEAGIDPARLRCRAVVSMLTGGNWKSLIDGTTAVAPIPDLGVVSFPDLAVHADADAGTLTIVRARPYVSNDRSLLDVLVFDHRPPDGPEAGPRPLEVTLKPDDELPADTGVDPEIIAFGRRQIGVVPPADDIEVDPAASPVIVALHAWLEGRLGLGAG